MTFLFSLDSFPLLGRRVKDFPVVLVGVYPGNQVFVWGDPLPLLLYTPLYPSGTYR